MSIIKYEKRLINAVADIDLINELNNIGYNESAINDAFYRDLEFGTVVFPAAYDGDTTPGASMALVSHILR